MGAKEDVEKAKIELETQIRELVKYVPYELFTS